MTGCPKCGCRHASAVQMDDWMLTTDDPDAGDEVTELRTCRYCGTQYTVDPDADDYDCENATVRYGRTFCPRCSSAQTPVVHTERPIRRHKCRNCGYQFKSYE